MPNTDPLAGFPHRVEFNGYLEFSSEEDADRFSRALGATIILGSSAATEASAEVDVRPVSATLTGPSEQTLLDRSKNFPADNEDLQRRLDEPFTSESLGLDARQYNPLLHCGFRSYRDLWVMGASGLLVRDFGRGSLSKVKAYFATNFSDLPLLEQPGVRDIARVCTSLDQINAQVIIDGYPFGRVPERALSVVDLLEGSELARSLIDPDRLQTYQLKAREFAARFALARHELTGEPLSPPAQ